MSGLLAYEGRLRVGCGACGTFSPMQSRIIEPGVHGVGVPLQIPCLWTLKLGPFLFNKKMAGSSWANSDSTINQSPLRMIFSSVACVGASMWLSVYVIATQSSDCGETDEMPEQSRVAWLYKSLTLPMGP